MNIFNLLWRAATGSLDKNLPEAKIQRSAGVLFVVLGNDDSREVNSGKDDIEEK